MFSSADPPLSRPTTQRRSRETRDKLINALDGLLREKDFQAINVAEIAGRAGVSVATIYQRFHNRDAAVAILIALYLRRVTQWWDELRNAAEGPGPSSLREALVQVGHAAWRQIDELRYVMRPAYLQSRLRPDLLDGYWREQEERAVHGFHALLQQHAAEIHHPDLSRAAAMVAYFFNAMFLGRLLHLDGVSSWGNVGPDEFAEDLADFACGYLGAVARPQENGAG